MQRRLATCGPCQVADGEISGANQNRHEEQLRAQRRTVVVVAEREAGQDAEVLQGVADDQGESREDEEPPPPVAERAVDDEERSAYYHEDQRDGEGRRSEERKDVVRDDE